MGIPAAPTGAAGRRAGPRWGAEGAPRNLEGGTHPSTSPPPHPPPAPSCPPPVCPDTQLVGQTGTLSPGWWWPPPRPPRPRLVLLLLEPPPGTSPSANTLSPRLEAPPSPRRPGLLGGHVPLAPSPAGAPSRPEAAVQKKNGQAVCGLMPPATLSRLRGTLGDTPSSLWRLPDMTPPGIQTRVTEPASSRPF